jgi:hypothetical protein
MNAEFEKSAFHHFHLDISFFIQLLCHTGSYEFLDWSYWAIADFYFSHSSISIIDRMLLVKNASISADQNSLAVRFLSPLKATMLATV